MVDQPGSLRTLFLLGGLAHLAIGFFGTLFPRRFFDVAPPWPPLHVGQIQIAGIFDLTMATVFLAATADVGRFAPLAIVAGVVSEWGHAAVRIGHVLAGDNPRSDLFLPAVMLVFGAILALSGVGPVGIGFWND